MSRVYAAKDIILGHRWTLRQHERRNLQIRFKLGGMDSDGHFFEEMIQTEDLSTGGGSFSSKNRLQPGSTLKLSGASGFLSMVQVIWSRLEKDSSSYRCGFAFLHPLDSPILAD
ncbi:MAG: PilZ domain-containing protein [Acidobacteriota bacterium]